MRADEREREATARRLREWADGARAGVLPRREFLTLAGALGLGASGAYGLLGLAAPRPAAAQTAPQGGVLRVAMAVRPIRDPRLFTWPESAEIARQICEPLVRYRADGALEPWLLQGWETAPDASEYVLKLRPGVRWSNGDAFEAEDVLANLRRWCDRSAFGNSMADRCAALIDPGSGQLADGAAEAVDALTVKLRLVRPDVTLMASLTDYPALITHRGFDEAGGDLAATPIGTGPFEFVSLEDGARAEVKRRESGRWWGGAPALDGVVWRDFGEDAEAERAAFEAGELDLTYQTTPDRAEALEALGLIRSAAPSAETMVIRCNRAAEAFADPRIAQAFQKAVDPQAVLEAALNGEGATAEHHHVWTRHPEYAPAPAPTRDLNGAKRLLRAAGAKDLKVALVSLEDGGYRKRTADAVAAQIGEAGVTVTRETMPSRLFWNGWLTHPFSATEWRMRPLAAQTLALAYRSGAVWNESAFADPVFDALLDVALEVADLEARRVVMRRLQRRLQRSGAIIQPYWRPVIRHHAPRVKGLEAHPMLEQHFERVSLAEA
ncbi:MAG: ABC transporter substrate-binding protein [Pseudomonadota bacterium]